MNGKSPNTYKENETDEQFGISLPQYPLAVNDEDRKVIRTTLFTCRNMVSLSLLPLRTKIKKRSTETVAEVWKHLFSYLVEMGLAETNQP
jgi:hypothetical protein